MIIVRGRTFEIGELVKAESILFWYVGVYYYVESGIVDNELRVLKNWKVAERPGCPRLFVTRAQGTEIPQELGDWLVAHQDNNQATNKPEQTEDQTED